MTLLYGGANHYAGWGLFDGDWNIFNRHLMGFLGPSKCFSYTMNRYSVYHSNLDINSQFYWSYTWLNSANMRVALGVELLIETQLVLSVNIFSWQHYNDLSILR